MFLFFSDKNSRNLKLAEYILNFRRVQFSQLLLSSKLLARSASIRLGRPGPRSYGRAQKQVVEDSEGGYGKGIGGNDLTVGFGNREEFLRCSKKPQPGHGD